MSCELPSTAEYARREYWDARFSTETSYEWLGDLSLIWTWLRGQLGADTTSLCRCSILHVGCGNSALSTRLHSAGLTRITNLDYSATLVRRFAQLQPQFDWICADMRRMEAVADGAFDVVIEKAAIDTLCAAEQDVWRRSDRLRADIDSSLCEISRALRPGGLFLSITFDQPHFRLPLLLANPDYGWNLQLTEVGDELPVFCYACRKGEPLCLSAQLRSTLTLVSEAQQRAAQPVVYQLDCDDDEAFLADIQL